MKHQWIYCYLGQKSNGSYDYCDVPFTSRTRRLTLKDINELREHRRVAAGYNSVVTTNIIYLGEIE